jgi:hypothetical protein
LRYFQFCNLFSRRNSKTSFSQSLNEKFFFDFFPRSFSVFSLSFDLHTHTPPVEECCYRLSK